MWQKSNPADDALLINFPANCRDNWQALEDLTNAALQITNAKVATGAGIVDTKLATISTAGKVQGDALTLLGNTPSGAGTLPDANLPHKLKADASDTTPQYLDSLIDTSVFQISAGDLLQLADNGVATEKLESGGASPGNSKYYGTDSGGNKGFFTMVHGDLSGAGGSNNDVNTSGDTIIDNINTDDEGHITSIGTRNKTSNPPNSSVGQGELKTSTGQVSQHISAGSSAGTKAISGGLYSFVPQFKHTSGSVVYASGIVGADGGMTTSYVTYVTLQGSESGVDFDIYSQNRYVTSSGKDHWIILTVDKETGQITGGYQAPDHPCYGNGDNPDDMDLREAMGAKENEEVIVVDNEVLNEAKEKVTSKRGLLEIINEDYEVDMKSQPKYEPREHIFIDEIGDKDGEVSREKKTPQWAKIAITSDKIQFKRKMINKLPDNVKFKKLKKKGLLG